MIFYLLCSYLNACICITIADSVSQQIVEYTLHLVCVTRNKNIRLHFKFQLQVFLGQHRLKLICQLFEHPRQIDFSIYKRNIGKIEPRDLKKFVNQIFKAFCLIQ